MATFDAVKARQVVFQVHLRVALILRIPLVLLGLTGSDFSVKKGSVWWLRYREREGVGQTVVVTVQSPEVL